MHQLSCSSCSLQRYTRSVSIRQSYRNRLNIQMSRSANDTLARDKPAYWGLDTKRRSSPLAVTSVPLEAVVPAHFGNIRTRLRRLKSRLKWLLDTIWHLWNFEESDSPSYSL